MAKMVYGITEMEYTWSEFKEDLKAGREMQLQHRNSEISILFVQNNKGQKVIALIEQENGDTRTYEYKSRWQILKHRFKNTMNLSEMWKNITVIDIA